jgi:curved DNA-binding protein CbpA
LLSSRQKNPPLKNPKAASPARPSPPKPTEKQLRAFFRELKQILDRVERATSHYQVLGLDRLAASGEIKMGYLRSVAFLHPSYFEIAVAIPASLMPQIDEAFEKVSQAFAVLVSFNRRVEYDNTLIKEMGEAADEVYSELRTGDLPTEYGAIALEALQRESGTDQSAATPEAQSEETGKNRRRSERFKLTIPVRITGYDSKFGRWHELTQTLDVSQLGAKVRMRRRVLLGMVVNLALPLPSNLRHGGDDGSTYNVYALVRRVEPTKGGLRTVGFEFLGEQPPDGYMEKPWGTFEPSIWTGVERRRWPRENRSQAVWIEYFTDSMECLGREIARTENMSCQGMRIVHLKQAPSGFDVIRVSTPSRGLQRFAVVCNRYTGLDKFERLCLRIIGEEWPM